MEQSSAYFFLPVKKYLMSIFTADNKIKVLMLDDDEGELRLFNNYIQDLLDIDCKCTSSHLGAINEIKLYKPTVFIIDYLNRSNIGLKVIEDVIALKEVTTEVICYSNNSEYREKVLDIGVFRFLDKGREGFKSLIKAIRDAHERNKSRSVVVIDKPIDYLSNFDKIDVT